MNLHITNACRGMLLLTNFVFLCLSIILGGCDNNSEVGAGRSIQSPDGRFRADASILTRTETSGLSKSYLDIYVEDSAHGRVIVREMRPLDPDSKQPEHDQGNAAVPTIVWAPDSSSVSINVEDDGWIDISTRKEPSAVPD